MRPTKSMIIVALLCLGSTGAMASSKDTPSLQDRQQAACFGDAQKLCGDTIPDVAKTTACMKEKRALVSPGCAAMYDIKS